jgi:superfamily I DNA and/or RNA helicase
MHPSILTFPNSQFYNYGIQSGANVLKLATRIAYHVQLIDTCNIGCEEADAFLWKNEFEASIIKLTLQMDDDISRIRKGVHQARTIVITPYKAQVLLATLASIANLGIVEVATVDSFQGQEGDIVLLSTVRTDVWVSPTTISVSTWRSLGPSESCALLEASISFCLRMETVPR